MIIHYDIPDELHRALKVQAAKEGITLKALIIRLLGSVTGENLDALAVSPKEEDG